jgi:hypothetical protein
MDVLTHGRSAPDPFGGHRRTMLRYGLWLRLATAGGLMGMGAASALAQGPASLNELVAALAGAALTVFAWRRAMSALDAADASLSATDAASAVPERSRRVRTGGSADAIRSRGALAARQG